ncbi:MAG TPA: rhamnan synthesis F family protein [Puia sp.]|nr:rhamnan synthesis F family protein [Puia sp.]
MNPPSCSIFFHNYYGRHEDWIRLFSQKIGIAFTLFYNITDDSLYNLEDDHRLMDRLQQAISGPWLKKIVLRRSPNQGKDIGGKLVLLDTCLHEQENSEYSIFLHDKKSPYKIQNQEWKDKLFRIIEPSFAEKAMVSFAKNKEIGIIAGSDSIYNEYDYSQQAFISNNRSQLIQLRSGFAIDSTDYRYVAGTMFWVRSLPLLDFFRRYPPLEIRKTLEKGNIMDETSGSNTHAWERMLSWLIFAQGYTIKGL